MDSEIFAAGLSWEAYLASMTSERALLASKVAEFRLPPDEAAFWAGYSRPLNVLIFTEDWCQDSVTALPPLVAVARTAPAITLRVRRRSEAAGLARALLKDEYPPVPVFLFYDTAFHELGRFIASPVGWDEVMADPEQRAWLRSDPALYDALWAELELAQFRAIVGG